MDLNTKRKIAIRIGIITDERLFITKRATTTAMKTIAILAAFECKSSFNVLINQSIYSYGKSTQYRLESFYAR